MNDFGQQVKAATETAIVKFLQSGEWLQIKWSEKLALSQADFRGIYASVDMDRVKARVKEKIEERIADCIIQSMATEIGTDVKQIMCNTELREDLRATLRTTIRGAKEAVAK